MFLKRGEIGCEISTEMSLGEKVSTECYNVIKKRGRFGVESALKGLWVKIRAVIEMQLC